jgi:tyrosinase
MANDNSKRVLAAPYRPDGDAKTYTSEPIPIEFVGPEHRFYRADLEIDGVTHAGPSYEGRIFLNNPGATKDTETTLANGYAGSFHIFGHGGCLGDEGHCEVKESTDAYDYRTPNPLTPAQKRVTITQALVEACRQGNEVTVTVVPVVSTTNELVDDDDDVFHCLSMHFLTYN